MSLLNDIKNEVAGVSLLDELQNAPEESGEYTESEQWRPEAGEGIEGVVVETYSFPGKFPDAKTGTIPTIPGWVLKVDGDDTHWSVAGLHSVLRTEMEKADAQPGDRVAVLYSGIRQSKGGSDYHHYRVAIRRGNGSPAPEQRKASSSGGTANQESAPKPRRKPGQKAVTDDAPF